MRRSWDVFCRVIDNYGDAAVCWRLAQQLFCEHDGRVRLWIDTLAPLHSLCPAVDGAAARQTVAGVEVRRWDAAAEFGEPADVAVDAFGAGLPEAYAEAMAQRLRRPEWIVLEYLSAEPWVGSHHRLPSPHPRLPLARHFFFPGVIPGTGGVLREVSFDARRAAFDADAGAQERLWRDLGFAPPAPDATCISLFGYENPGVRDLLEAWAGGGRRVVAAVTQSRLRPEVAAFFGAAARDGEWLARGSLEARFLPFVAQPCYDELLWACDWNFVRGEDSFVRAQWAGRPLVWQIYPQAGDAHRVKLEAFLDVYCAGLEAPAAAALRGLWQAWNTLPSSGWTPGSAWQALAPAAASLSRHAQDWDARLRLPGELAANLAQFCSERLK